MKVQVEITRLPSVADPEAATITGALRGLGFTDLVSVSLGRLLVIEVEADDATNAEVSVRRMCSQLLANPVIEDYSVRVVAEDEAG